MRTPEQERTGGLIRALLEGERALCGRVVVSWTLSGGVAMGGLLVASATLANPELSRMILPAIPLLFIVGAAGGLLHGLVLAYLGRPDGVPPRSALRIMGLALLSLVAGLPFAMVTTAWISLTPAALFMKRASTLSMALLGWVTGVALCTWAVIEGAKAAQHALARWPHRRAGSRMLAATLVLVLAALLAYRPVIGSLRITGLAAVAAALLLTTWIGGPLVVLSLWAIRRDQPTPQEGP